VLGGYNQGTRYSAKLNQCEKLVADLSWQRISDMREVRCDFNPCLWEDTVYVCGLTEGDSCSIEAMNLNAEYFIPTQISFPNSDACCLYIEQDQLVVLSFDHIRKYKRTTLGQLALKDEDEIHESSKAQNSQPVVMSGRLYVTRLGECRAFDLETGKCLEKIS